MFFFFAILFSKKYIILTKNGLGKSLLFLEKKKRLERKLQTIVNRSQKEFVPRKLGATKGPKSHKVKL